MGAAAGQPQDALHGFWRSLTDNAEDNLLGFNGDIAPRRQASDILLAESGPDARKYEIEDALPMVNIWAWIRAARDLSLIHI